MCAIFLVKYESQLTNAAGRDCTTNTTHSVIINFMFVNYCDTACNSHILWRRVVQL